MWFSQPVRYAFEGIMTNEFHTLDGTCSSLVPSGAGYEGISLSNQVCTVVGSQTGQATVNGNTYLADAFGYYYKNLWRVCLRFLLFWTIPDSLFSGFRHTLRFWSLFCFLPALVY